MSNSRPTPEISIVGGLQNVHDVYAAPLENAIRERFPHCIIQPPEYDPVIGACLLALEQLGIAATSLRERLKLSQRQLRESTLNN